MAQNFVTTRQYSLKEYSPMAFSDSSYNDSRSTIFNLFNVADSSEYLYKLELEFVDPIADFSCQVLEMDNSGIDQIDKVLNVKLDYLACCSSITSYYILFKRSGDIIGLPPLQYNHCDGPEPFKEYRFPSQKFGENNVIISTNSFRNTSWEVDSIAIISRIQLSELTQFSNK